MKSPGTIRLTIIPNTNPTPLEQERWNEWWRYLYQKTKQEVAERKLQKKSPDAVGAR